MASKQQFTVFLGNLRKNIRIGLLKQNLVMLLKEIGIEVQKFDINISKGQSTCYAFVNLDNGMEEQHVIHTLSAADGLSLKTVSLDDIVAMDRALRVAKKHDRIVKEVKEQENEQRVKDGQGLFVMDPDLIQQSPRYMNPFENNRPKSPPMGRQKYKKRKSRSRAENTLKKSIDFSSDSEEEEARPSRPNYGIVSPYDQENREDIWRKDHHEDSEDEQLALKNRTYQQQWLDNVVGNHDAFTPSVNTKQTNMSPTHEEGHYVKALKKKYPFDHFVLGHHVGVEDRNTEFKEGGGNTYLKKKLKEHTGKYVVSFLNSSGGKLLVGVNDEGKVVGVKCNQKQEDKARISIDHAIKAIRPSVFPETYSISFIPVISSEDNTFGDLKVIRIAVESADSSHLFETKSGHVYIRRDASVQGPLKAREIQEWAEIRYRLEMKQKEQELTNLRYQQAQLRDQLAESDTKTQELNETLARLESEYDKKSKVCIIV
ncbi:uncharacterized protein LOC135502739 [Lineus longissimus]|uniref:uncharacterized protein LOC135502739 n=1 Tax=Lineus longissimus TaxID=88925 RepID=UPI002B4FB5D1